MHVVRMVGPCLPANATDGESTIPQTGIELVAFHEFGVNGWWDTFWMFGCWRRIVVRIMLVFMVMPMFFIVCAGERSSRPPQLARVVLNLLQHILQDVTLLQFPQRRLLFDHGAVCRFHGFGDGTQLQQ